ncbi:ABC transporter permease subunit [Chelatococcus daeguensis]|uniref:sn-glycerol-3-phosphate transport system permease protein UgpA n=1 Tax=Chelatococcus sambhunathii TaxID=363953 RepID=A0ABP2A455_9HYPH|nr:MULTISPECIES: ABC transporter permease subunit [Chelatococcus]KZE27481.1 glycerol-3-phosphate transporter permease [Chelatococcus daeguensis]MBM3085703.1 ABC transporter permease subunit [Chelatococcus daeguensis]CUA84453.1 ABC-type sugar transport system, permease component [Chelatococcus sambhunathii]
MEKRAVFRAGSLAYLLILPQLLLVFVFFYWPTGAALYWAFTLEMPWGGGNQWVGLENFSAVLNDAKYWSSVAASCVFAFAATALALAQALVLALFVDRQLRGSKSFRSFYVWPYAVAAPAVSLAFRFIFAPETGLVAFVNQWWPGLWNPSINGAQAMTLVVLCFAWKWIGYNFIFLLAALQSIPRALTEASAMDGAGPLRRMLDIQLPLLTPTFFFLLVINLTESFVGADSFGIVDILTEGGPANATNLLVYKIYSDGFKGLDYSGAAAQSIILMLLVMVLTFIQFRWVERRVHYK